MPGCVLDHGHPKGCICYCSFIHLLIASKKPPLQSLQNHRVVPEEGVYLKNETLTFPSSHRVRNEYRTYPGAHLIRILVVAVTRL